MILRRTYMSVTSRFGDMDSERLLGLPDPAARQIHPDPDSQTTAKTIPACFALTPSKAAHKISPESSDGFASVGTFSLSKGCPVAGQPFSLSGLLCPPAGQRTAENPDGPDVAPSPRGGESPSVAQAMNRLLTQYPLPCRPRGPSAEALRASTLAVADRAPGELPETSPGWWLQGR